MGDFIIVLLNQLKARFSRIEIAIIEITIENEFLFLTFSIEFSIMNINTFNIKMIKIIKFLKLNSNSLLVITSLLAIIIIIFPLVLVNNSLLEQIVSVQKLTVDAFLLGEDGKVALNDQLILDVIEDIDFSIERKSFAIVQGKLWEIEPLITQYRQSDISTRGETVFYLHKAIMELSLHLSEILNQRLKMFRMLFFLMNTAIFLHFAVSLFSLLANQKLREKEKRDREFLETANSFRIKERHQVAEILHDRILQDVAVLYMNPDLSNNSDLKESINNITDNMRTVINSLEPLHLKTVGVTAAFQDFIQNFQSTNLKISITGSMDESLLAYEKQYDLYVSLQQLVMNVKAHAEASELTIDFNQDESGIKVTVRDNGYGFPIPHNLKAYAELGLSLGIMENRFEHYGGKMNIESISGAGTTVRLQMPNN
ncbi:hypothetical protein DV872_23060 [Oceanispirochaeta sp. M1]|nr:hypothetical protein DV872_23060 [Oceanispirochaeta sp. M1]